MITITISSKERMAVINPTARHQRHMYIQRKKKVYMMATTINRMCPLQPSGKFKVEAARSQRFSQPFNIIIRVGICSTLCLPHRR